jgi:hypothetical protein
LPSRILVSLGADADADQVINDVVQALERLAGRIRSITLLSPTLDEIYLKYVEEGESA